MMTAEDDPLPDFPSIVCQLPGISSPTQLKDQTHTQKLMLMHIFSHTCFDTQKPQDLCAPVHILTGQPGILT